MVDNSKSVRKQVLDVIGCVFAIVTVIAYLIMCINAQWPFIDEGSLFLNILKVIETFAPLIVVAVVGWEAVATKNIVIRVIYYAIIALIVIFMFFPGTWSNLVGLVK